MQNHAGPVQHERSNTYLDDGDATAMDISLQELHIDVESGMQGLNGEDGTKLMAGSEADEFDFSERDSEGDISEEDDGYGDDGSEEDVRPSQYDLRQYGVYQSLPIPSGPPDMQSDCDTAEEYLKRVR